MTAPVNPVDPSQSAPPERPLNPWLRLIAVVAAWGMLGLAGPGALEGKGTPALAVLAIALWSAAAARPGRFAFLIEWFGASLGFAIQLEWIRHVALGALVPTGLGMGLYAALAGPLLRALVRRRVLFPLAVGAAWTFAETLRALYPPPIGHGWLLLGHLSAAWQTMLEGARVFSVVGATFALASLGGFAASLARLHEARRRGDIDDDLSIARTYGPVAIAGLTPLAAVFAAGALTSSPEMEPGPRLLLVQPSVAQERKMEIASARDLFDLQRDTTRAGLDAIARLGEPPPDLVCWAETMLPLQIVDPSARAGIEAGVDFPAWRRDLGDPRVLVDFDAVEEPLIQGEVFGRGRRAARPALLPEGTSFLAGLEVWTERGGELRRLNGVALWPAKPGAPRQLGAKRFLVPGAEGLMGLERFGWVRRAIAPVAGYIPDFVSAERTAVFELPRAVGRDVRIGASVCFDNAFLATFLDPLRAGEIDMHLVVSNEAWYLDSYELDQMVAFSRLAAVASGRAIARCTNSGVTAVFGPDGREIARLVVDGRDRLVPGALATTVPIPVRPATGPTPRPPAVYLDLIWRWLFILLGPGLLLGARLCNRRRVGR